MFCGAVEPRVYAKEKLSYQYRAWARVERFRGRQKISLPNKSRAKSGVKNIALEVKSKSQTL